MAQKENALGAPTQGLGQTVTFDQGNSGGVPVARAGQQPQAKTGVTDIVQAVEGGYQRTEVEDTTSALFALAGKAFGPLLEKKRQERFTAGMQRAMQGESIQDIAKDQPFFNRMFGDSDVVEGARQYTAAKQVSDMGTAVMDSLDETQKLGPAEAQKFFNDQLTGRLTGDSATDAAIMNAHVRQMPVAMKAQSKAHYKWLQARAAQAQDEAFTSGINELESLGAKVVTGDVSDKDFHTRLTQFVFDSAPVEGQSYESFEKRRADGIKAAAASGQFHAIRALRGMGFIDSLPAAVRDDVMKAIDTGETRKMAQVGIQYAQQEGVLRSGLSLGTISADQGRAAMLEVNAQIAKQTGMSKPYFSTEDIAGGYANSLSANYRNIQEGLKAEKARGLAANTELAKAASKAAEIATMELAVSRKMQPANITASDIDPVLEQSRQKYGVDSQEYMQVRLNLFQGPSKGFIDNTEARGLQVGVETAAAAGPDAMGAAYAKWLPMFQSDPTMTEKYYGPMADRMERYHQIVKGNPGVAGMLAAHNAAFVQERSKVSWSKDERKGYRKELASNLQTWMPEWYSAGAQGYSADGRMTSGNISMRDDQMGDIMHSIEYDVERRANAGQAEPVKRAVQALKSAKDFSFMGGFAVQNPSGFEPPETYLMRIGVASDHVAPAFRDAVKTAVEAGGANFDDPTKIMVARGANADDFQFIILSDGDKPTTSVVTGAQIKAAAERFKDLHKLSTRPVEPGTSVYPGTPELPTY